jgi:uncharacterized RDD family membrane protein YckC
MQVICAKCSRVLDYSGERPSFCAYCGQALPAAQHTPCTHDAEAATLPAAPPAAPPVPAPREVAGYRLLRELGAGGMGGVYEAEETASGRRVALKLIAPELAGSADTVERFRQEGRIASMVVHPRCVFVHAVDEDAGQPYIVMELMPGATLKDHVDQHGPLPPEQAIAKILDVIEGLQAAHRLEVIHRDVKPSNCFLEPDGRVKVGDFGLAKSLVKDAHLTKTGAFVGTPYFASPEQVRGEGLDQQTDVYSVAATLYFLLTGQPPFWGTDSAATLARIVADPPPPLRSLRPELSPALDRIVLRGLDRDRKRRWQDLEEFKQVLLGLVPAPLSWSAMHLRLAAYLVDLICLGGFCHVVLAIVGWVVPAARSWLGQAWPAAFSLVFAAAYLAYFTILEHSWGCAVGKRLWRLRVCSSRWLDPPGWGPAALRTTLCFACLHLWMVPAFAYPPLLIPALGIAAVGLAVLVWPMRERNGFRGLHELLSHTRVAQLPQPRRGEHLLSSGGWLLSVLQSRRLDRGSGPISQLPQRIAGFAVRGALKWTPSEKVLLGEDASFGRRVFIWMRPQAEPPLGQARRDVGRRSRLRWLSAGKQGDLQWDAILAPAGCPLPDYVHSEGGLAWPEARTLLEDLAGELSAACADGTLPRSLSRAQVWVQDDGRARLADTALAAGDQAEQTAGTDQERALALLRAVAALALEGRPRQPGDTAAGVRATLPAPAREVIERLLGQRYESVEQLRAELAAPREE